MAGLLARLAGERGGTGIVPSSGGTALVLTVAAAATAFLAVAAICLGLAAERIAGRWQSELARAATLRLPPAPSGEAEARLARALALLAETPGIASARALGDDEQAALLEPWLGGGLPLDLLPVPRLVEVVETAAGPDRDSLAKRLAAELPGAVYDDHGRWRGPLLAAAGRLEALALVAVLLTVLQMGVLVTLAARAALAAHRGILVTLRLVGADDGYITGAFVRRFALRAFQGATAGTALAVLAVLAVPVPGAEGALATGLAPRGAGWAGPLAVPVVATLLAVLATRRAARRVLAGTP